MMTVHEVSELAGVSVRRIRNLSICEGSHQKNMGRLS